jgi:D-3-phosphoglycerate dehydrogenase
VVYRGELAEKETKVLTAVFAAGLLQNALEEEVNLVNAELLLKQRGIGLTEESRSEMGSFRASMTAEMIADNAQHRATGTVFGQQMPRLVSLDDFRLEAFLDGYLLVFRHRDVPGIIGGVGTIFGQHGVNIAQMAVGRAAPGGEAVGVLNLDTEPSAEALAEVRRLPAITSATVVRLPPAGELPCWLQGYPAFSRGVGAKAAQKPQSRNRLACERRNRGSGGWFQLIKAVALSVIREPLPLAGAESAQARTMKNSTILPSLRKVDATFV